MTRSVRRTKLPLLLFIGFVVAVTLTWLPTSRAVNAYGVAVTVLLIVKISASMRNRATEPSPEQQRELDALRLGTVVPFYNEDPEALRRCVASLLAQQRPLGRVVLVDDGSSDARARELARRLAAEHEQVVLVEQATNLGKREAMVAGFLAAGDIDVVVAVDSDTVLAPDAVAEAMKEFASAETMAVTGTVLAENARRNILTRLIDLRYANAFLYERAAYSSIGSVLCVCGSLALYRAHLVRDNAEDFLGQRFLGRPAVFGDDRRMTNYALTAGRVVLRENAVATTLVPERMGHFLRQQVRWNKSFFRESVWVLRNMSSGHPAFWLTFVEFASWVVFTTMLLVAMVLRPIATGEVLFGTYLAFISLVAYARSVRWFNIHDGAGRRERWLTFLLAPLYGFLHLFVLMPLRVWSLLTLRSGSWGTRSSVEVHLTDADPRAPRGAGAAA